MDLFNVAHLLNEDWGRIRFVPSEYQVLQFEGFAEDAAGNETKIPTFSFDSY